MISNINLYCNPFLKIDYNKSQLLLEISWLPETKKMTPSEYQECFYTYINVRKKYKVNKVLLDESQMFFIPDPKLQNWASNLINTKLSTRASHIAIVLSKEFIQQLLVKILIEEVLHDDFNYLFFTSKNDALQWLIDDILIEAH